MPTSIRAAACRFPDSRVPLEDVLREEGVSPTENLLTELGAASVPTCASETGSELALEACQEALAASGHSAKQIDVIIDYSILPQEYLVPAWSMGNKLQADLGAKRAFTLGFSAGGASNFQVALSSARALVETDPTVECALLVGAEVAIPGNRVLNPDRPTCVLGDGASAVVVTGEDGGDTIIAQRLRSVGALHDVCFIPGGAMEHPTNSDLYKMRLDHERSEGAPEAAAGAALELLKGASIDVAKIDWGITANISTADRRRLSDGTDLSLDRWVAADFSGHVQGTDLVHGYLKSHGPGRRLLLVSHGWGHMPAATLIEGEGASE